MNTVAKLKQPFAVKSQVLIAGRGKAGGILFADSVEEAEKAAEKLLKTAIKGIRVKKVLIEEARALLVHSILPPLNEALTPIIIHIHARGLGKSLLKFYFYDIIFPTQRYMG